MKNLIARRAAVTLSAVLALGFAGFAFAAPSVNLGAANSFAVLAGSAVTSATPSVIQGDVGLSPSAGTLYTGITPSAVTGSIYAVDATGPSGSINNPALLTSAQNDLASAYVTLAAQPLTNRVAGDLGGLTLTPGVYKDNGAPASLSVTGTLTLDGAGDPNAVFVFQSASTLVTGANSHIALINGAQACNVFWQVGSSATLGTGSDFKGNLIALSSITDNGGSTVNGRLLARNAAVTLNNTHVTKATCAVAPTPAPVPAPVATSTPVVPVVPVITPVPTVPNTLPAAAPTVSSFPDTGFPPAPVTALNILALLAVLVVIGGVSTLLAKQRA